MVGNEAREVVGGRTFRFVGCEDELSEVES